MGSAVSGLSASGSSRLNCGSLLRERRLVWVRVQAGAALLCLYPSPVIAVIPSSLGVCFALAPGIPACAPRCTKVSDVTLQADIQAIHLLHDSVSHCTEEVITLGPSGGCLGFANVSVSIPPRSLLQQEAVMGFAGLGNLS